MAQMNLSNTLWNDDSSGTIALVEQLKDRLLHTYIANNPNYSTTDKDRIPVELKEEAGVFQEKLNEFFLDHWVDFQRFLLDEGVDPETIDSWKEVQEFLEGLPDDETMWLKNKLAALDTAIAGIDQDGIGIFDVSAYNNIGGTYATYNGLSTALAAIPTASKRSGMTIRYIDSTSNQYEEYKYFLQYEDTTAGNAAFNNTANWQGIDDKPTADSNNLIKSGGVYKEITQLDQKVTINYFDGNGNNYVVKNIYGLIPGRTYRISLFTDTWDTSGFSGTGYKFVIRNAYNDEFTVLDGTQVRFNCKKYYDFKVPTDSDYIEIGGRAKSGTKIWFSIEDVTDFYLDECSVYFLAGASPAFSRSIVSDASMTVTVSINAKFRIVQKNGIASGDIDLRNQSFTVGNYQCLVYNLNTNILEVVSYPLTTNERYVSFLGVCGTSVFGHLKPYYDRWVEASLANELDVVGSTVIRQADYDIVTGTISQGTVINIPSRTYMCLASNVFVYCFPNTTVKLIRRSDITVRVSEYGLRDDGTKYFLRDSGNYAAINTYTLGNDTKYIRISAYYPGYTSDNPVSVDDFTEGDFGIYTTSINEIYGILEGIEEDPTSIYKKNLDKIGRIKAASKTYVTGYSESALPKNYLFVIATDIHSNILSLKNAIDLADGVSQIDAVFNLGDQQHSYYDATAISAIQEAVSYGTKPKFVVLGNHDVGNSKKVRFTCNHQQAYEAYIKPIVDAGYLVNGEYQVNKSYYYHDITTQKVRLIFLNDYDETIELASSDYWEPVTYDSTKPLMTDSTSYEVGDVVNCGVYTDHSFRCIANCTSGTSSNSSSNQEPLYRMLRGRVAIQHDQAQWFLDTLLSTPQDYSILVVSHSVFSQNVTALTSSKFCQNSPFSASIAQDMMDTDFVAEAVNAFINGNNFSINVAFKSEGAYMNVQGNYAYTVSKDFSAKNTGIKFIGYLNGHFHQDIVWQHNTYTSQKSVSPTTSSPSAGVIKNSDLYRSADLNDVNYDALTIVGLDTKNTKMCLARIGADISTDMYMRDVEKIG